MSKIMGFQRPVASQLNLPNLHKKVLLASVFVVGAALLWPTQQEFSSQRIPVAIDIDSLLPHIAQQDNTLKLVKPISPILDRVIESGDTLSHLFELAGIDQRTMYKVLEADLEVLALDTLLPGNRIQFWDNANGELDKLELYFSPAHQVVFSRFKDGTFAVNDINIDGIWQNRIVGGEINGSFYVSAKNAGLSAAEIQKVETLLKTKLNFSRELRAGDTFSVLVNDQFVEGEPTGTTSIEGIRINTGRRDITAFQNVDGNYYDIEGQSLTPAFQRIPLNRKVRLSSRFNPNRKHPITGRIRPHNGTDFATPIGTQVVAPGDGIVTMVTKHPYAGNYIVIQHDNKVSTRYLHLSKFLVKRGQRVTRGQPIGLSGNTGASTGPHLHYEFIVNGRPVDAMKASIAEAKVLPKKQLQAFQALVRSRSMMMDLG
ncbi:peptidoglycan DD-metalloendopeptidase family protein [Shewanella livingstonensis]|uniref:Peptidase M23 n=1 Tax=Shewanella livingstonensis TaxID=150120 RepID=A0A3G8LU07_9GAMM|nr:peptidoglycan DD-metalloendopeptidase family protein [Shewanella livingstonensis]AZG72864.1 peptidase M23 [Shewanella livingstonensis]